MGCSSSSSQTVDQEKRPGTKPEESNGDALVKNGNGFIPEDTETIADQMQLPVQSALPDDLQPGAADESEAVLIALEAQEDLGSGEDLLTEPEAQPEPALEDLAAPVDDVAAEAVVEAVETVVAETTPEVEAPVEAAVEAVVEAEAVAEAVVEAEVEAPVEVVEEAVVAPVEAEVIDPEIAAATIPEIPVAEEPAVEETKEVPAEPAPAVEEAAAVEPADASPEADSENAKKED